MENYFFNTNKQISYIKGEKLFSFSETDLDTVFQEYGLEHVDRNNNVIEVSNGDNRYQVYVRRDLHGTTLVKSTVLIAEYFDVVIFSKNSHLDDIDVLWKGSVDNRYLDLLRDEKVKMGFNSIFLRSMQFDSELLETGLDLLLSKDYVVYDKQNKSFATSFIVKDDLEYGRLCPVTKLVDLSHVDDIGFVFGSESWAEIDHRNLSFHGGKGVSRITAQLSAYGEAIERYSAASLGNVTLSTINELDKENIVYLDPRILSSNTVSSNSRIEWVNGKKLGTDDIILIPANAVQFPYLREDEYGFMPQTTTGLASGKGLEEAVEHAVLEVLERNSYSLVHKSLLPIKDIQLNTEQMNADVLNIVNTLAEKNINIEATLLPESNNTFVVHVVLVSNVYPKFTHGSGAGLKFEKAFTRAITEAVQMRTSQLLIKSQRQMNASSDNSVAYQWGVGKLDLVAPFRHSSEHETVSYNYLNGLKEILFSELLDYLNQKNFEVLYVDLTKEETKLNVAKAIIPGMQDIDPYNKMTTRRLLELGFVNYKPMYS